MKDTLILLSLVEYYTIKMDIIYNKTILHWNTANTNIWFGSLFNGMSTFIGYLMPRLSL